MRIISLTLLVAALASSLASAQGNRGSQAPPPAATPAVQAPLVQSPEVQPDRRVTFRLLAPKAAEVVVQGEWGRSRVPERVAMMKGIDGVWAATVGPLAPDPYRYLFMVDGVRVVDPRNTSTVSGPAGVQSLLVVRGSSTDVSTAMPARRGAVRIVWYSSPLGIMRRMHIYTPPDYDTSSESYPVLYLLHGASGDDSHWNAVGSAGLIADNLIAAGRTRPMVIVMPDSLPPGTPTDRLPLSVADDKFADDFRRAIVPYVEKNLRVRTDARSQAIAGLSMGGAQGMLIFLSMPRKFSYLGLFSAAWWPEDLVTVEKRHESVLADAELRKDLKLLWIGVGTDDRPAFPNTQALRAMFDRLGFKYTYRETDGDHTWINWRKYFAEFSTQLFR